MKNTKLIKATSILLLGSMLASCSNIKDDGTRTRTEGGLGGALLGGLAGAIIGNQHGHKSWQGALIGAAVGGLAGTAYGDHVAKKKAAYKRTEDWLNACIAQAEKTNARARNYNASLSQKINNLEQQINGAKSKGDKKELQNIKLAIVQLQKEAKQQRATVDNEIKAQNSAVSQGGGSAEAARLQTKVGELRTTQSAISQNETKLADLGRRIDV